MTYNPFQLVFDMLSPQSGTNISTLMALTSILAFIAILWQVIPLILNSDNDKLVTQKKSNIKKILIAFAIIISIEAIIRGANILRYKSGFQGGAISTTYSVAKNTITE